MGALRLAVLVAGLFSLSALAVQFFRTKTYGKRVLYAPLAGDPAAGARYAFTKGMLPQAKESVMMNLPSYLAGIAFHAGIFAAFGLLAASLAGTVLPFLLLLLFRVSTFVGALGGLVLLIKRTVKPHLRGLSSLDDFLANLLTTTFSALACATTFVPDLATIWLVNSIILLAYIPLGKIRHCVFFFSTRYHFGAFFGRRGTFPATS